jgi:hypothetical protein
MRSSKATRPPPTAMRPARAGVTADYPYSCSYTAGTKPATLTEYNQATAAWDASNALPDNSATSNFVEVDWPSTPTSTTHSCTTVVDTWSITSTATTLGRVCQDGLLSSTSNVYNANSPLSSFQLAYTASNPANTWTFTYTRSVTVVPSTCTEYDNTASISSDATSGDNTSGASVVVCGRVTGGLTMGFWQNKNGQGIISSYSGTDCQLLAAWLKGFNPFKDLTATTCGTSPSLTGKSTTPPSGVVGYVYNVIKAANCSGTITAPCNTMLKAQMLATALDVYFSDPAQGGNRISAPAPLGAVKVDLTNICKMIDGSGGTGTCSGSYENSSVEFGGGTCQTVNALLLFSNATSGSNYAWGNTFVSNSGGTTWYNNNKTYQVPAKDTFDAINNQVAFSCT